MYLSVDDRYKFFAYSNKPVEQPMTSDEDVVDEDDEDDDEDGEDESVDSEDLPEEGK